MREVLFQLGPIKIYGYGFMIMIGVVCAFLLAEYREKKIFKTENIFDLGFVSALGGVLGSKLLFWLTELPRILENPKYILSTMSSGFVVYGGLIGGILTGFLYCKINFPSQDTLIWLCLPWPWRRHLDVSAAFWQAAAMGDRRMRSGE